MEEFHVQIETCQYESTIYCVNMEVWRNEESYLNIRCYNFDASSLPQNMNMVIHMYDIPAINYGLQQCRKYYPHIECVTFTDKAFVVTSPTYRNWISLISYGILYHEKSWWEHWFHATVSDEEQCHTYNQLLYRLRDPQCKPSFSIFLGWLCPEQEDIPYFELIYEQERTLRDVFSQIHRDRRGLFNEWKLRSFFRSISNFDIYQLEWKIPLHTQTSEKIKEPYSLIGPIESLVF
jgi:hypothetical protein